MHDTQNVQEEDTTRANNTMASQSRKQERKSHQEKLHSLNNALIYTSKSYQKPAYATNASKRATHFTGIHGYA
jgi:hypothetical protein